MVNRTIARQLATLICAFSLCAFISGAASSETKGMATFGWKPHPIIKGEGLKAKVVNSDIQLLKVKEEGAVVPFGVAQMDNGEVILIASWHSKDRGELPVVSFSKDKGDTWSDWSVIPGAAGRAMMLAYLGKGNLAVEFGERYMSSDYGRTWNEKAAIPIPPGGQYWGVEGNPLVDRDASGSATWIAETGFCYAPGNSWPESPADEYIRWSNDGGRTWVNQTNPKEWYWEDSAGGKTLKRGASEGGLVRAKNGWLVAALRTDMPARYLIQPNNDSLEGTGVSISRDNGKTWSPYNFLFDAGRHHANLLLAKNGDIVMTLIVRDDIRNGKFASYRRGCDAIVSHDNGLTWKPSDRYELDRYEYFDGSTWFDGQCGHLYSTLLDDGRILTAYGNYLTGGATLIRWKPQ